MKCPHCLNGMHSKKEKHGIGSDEYSRWIVVWEVCPECKRGIIELERRSTKVAAPKVTTLVYPKGIARSPLPTEVPEGLAADYGEACLVLADSPKASAALSRRCLQSLLRDTAKVKKGYLADEIQQLLDSGQLPISLAENVDAIRKIGIFAAHPMKSEHSGEILDVEPEEAEWNLDVLEGLFDFYFVQPAAAKKKREKLGKKLQKAGKPPMKSQKHKPPAPSE